MKYSKNSLGILKKGSIKMGIKKELYKFTKNIKRLIIN